METIKFKTNIKCAGCIATVTPHLNKLAGVDAWQVDLEDPQRTLRVESDKTEQEIVSALKDAGFEAERI